MTSRAGGGARTTAGETPALLFPFPALCARPALLGLGLFLSPAVAGLELGALLSGALCLPFPALDPDGAGTSDQGERDCLLMISAGPSSSNLIASLANGRMLPNSSVTRRTTRVESAPSAISSESSGSSTNFVIHAVARKLLRDDLLALNVAFNPQVSPLVKEFAEFDDEGCVLKMRELFAVGIDFGHQLVRDVELQMVAVGADHGLRKSDGFVAARPVECGLKHDFFRRIALRFIESRSRFGFAEDVGDAVIADAVAGAEIAVGVVVESAPADAARILRIGGELVVDTGMTDACAR